MVAITNLHGSSVVYIEGDPPLLVDAGGDAVVEDADDLAGAVLTIGFTANGNSGEDVLDIDQSSGAIFEEGFVEGAAVFVDGDYVGYVGREGGAPGEPIVVVFDAAASADDVARIIRAVTYTNLDDDDPSGATRTLTFHLGFPSGAEASADVSIEVVPVLDINDPALVDMDTTAAGVSGEAAYVEQAAAILLAPHASVTDGDSPYVNGGRLVVSVAGATAFDQLSIQDQGYGSGKIKIESGIVVGGAEPGQPGMLSEGRTIFASFEGGANGAPLIVTFLADEASGNASIRAVDALYRAITYANTSNLPPASRTITFTLDDGGGSENGGNPITVSTVTVDVATVNDPPVVDLNGAVAGSTATLNYTENGAAARIAPAATVSDDNPAKFNGGSLTIAFADGGTATDQLTIGIGGAEDVGIDGGIGGGGSPDSGAITIGGSILASFRGGRNGAPLVVTFFPEGSVAGFTTMATVQAILRSISYSSTSDNPSTAPRTVTFTLNDGQGTANGGQDTTVATATVNVTSVPDTPVAVNDIRSIIASTVTQYSVADLIANDRDADGDSFTIVSVAAVSGGTPTLADGIITFTPSNAGPYSFRYTIRDPSGREASATVTLNRAPTAADDSVAAVKDSPATYSAYALLRNDTDVTGDAGNVSPMSITAVGNAVNGAVVLNSDGSVTFTPTPGYAGNGASFQYTITDGIGTRTATANVNVRTSNANPVAVDDTASVNEDTALAVTRSILVGNDTTSDGGLLVVLGVSNVVGGTATLLNNGNVLFTPTTNFNGLAGFDYVLSDSQGGTDTGHITITVNPVNDAPVANTDTVATLEDVPVVIGWDELLADDIDVDGDTLVITGVNTFGNGTATVDSFARTVTFTPTADYSLGRSFSFRYAISDGKGGTSSASVVVNVTPVNDPPSGKNGTVGVLESGTYVFTAEDFSAGFKDPRDMTSFNVGENRFAGVVITTLPGSGTLHYDADGAGGADPVPVVAGLYVSAADLAAGKLSYVADPDEIVNPTFTFQVRDDGGTANGGIDTDQSPNTMEIALTPLNDAPLVDLNGSGAGTSVIAAYSIGSSGVTIAPDATLRDDNPNFGGGSLLVYVDGFSFGDRLYVGEDSPGITLLGSQIYWHDDLIGRINNDGGTVLGIGLYPPATAAAVQALLRAIGYDGTNVFDTEPRTIHFTLNDGGGTDNGGADSTDILATVVFNNPPVADTSIAFTGTEDVPVVIQAAGLLANAFDPDGDAFTISAAYGNPDGAAVLSPDGATITFTPAANFNGAAYFEYDLRDAKGGTTRVTVNGTLAAAPDDPIARTDAISAAQGTPTVIQASQLLGNDFDPDLAGPITLTGVTSGTGGTAVLNGDGTVTFTPTPGLLGAASFTYAIADSNGGTATGTASVTIRKLVTANEDATATYTVADLFGTATDGSGRPLALLSVLPVSGGSVVLNPDGTVSFTSSPDFNGRATFDFILSDGSGNEIPGGALVEVAPMPDDPVTYPVTLFAPRDRAYSFDAADLLGASYDPDGTPIRIGEIVSATNGTAVLNADGSVTFQPGAGHEGAASFQFTVVDGNGGAAQADADIMVLRALEGLEDSETIFTAADIVGTTGFTNFALGFDFTGGFFQRLGNSVTFTPDPDFDGLASVDYSYRISGVPYTGRVLVDVRPVNDAPFGQGNSATVLEDQAHVFMVGDFPFNDVEGHALAGVIVSTLPGGGKLMLGAAEVTQGQFVSRADIAAGKLSFVPAADASGSGYGNFTFQVRDTGGTANDGEDTDASPAPFTLDVTPVNDAPVLAAAAAQPAYVEQAAPVQIAGDVTLTDDQAGFAGGALTVALTAGAAAGDALAIAAGGGVTRQGNDLRYDGNVFATITGESATGVTLSLNGAATAAAVEALVERFTFSNDSDTPGAASRQVSFTLVDGGGRTNGGSDTTTLVRTITVAPVEDPGVTQNDSATTAENAAVTIAVLANDSDPDGPAPSVLTIEGGSATVDAWVLLESGARVKLDADGTLTYDPNGQFDHLVPPSTNATNTSATDSFTYGIGGGSTATVTVTVTGVASPGDRLQGDGGANTLTGTGGSDVFMLGDGGDDTADGGDGIDGFYLGGALSPGDKIDGGAGGDALGLQGDYGNYTFSATNLVRVETLVLLSGSYTIYSGGPGTARYAYHLTTIDANVAAGQVLVVNGNQLMGGEDLYFDGSAETDGSFFFMTSAGEDTLIGGAGVDIFAPMWGADTMTGGGGNDLFYYRFATESLPSAKDHITDFTAGDLINLYGLGVAAGRTLAFLGDGEFTHSAGQLRVAGSGTSWLIEVDVDGDGVADFAIDVNTTASGYAWSASDFLV